MIIGVHLVFSAYGFWLPNDPRGSWSAYVGSRKLHQFGDATKTDARRSIAGVSHDRQQRLAAKQALKYPEVRFTGLQARAIGRGFGNYFGKSEIVVRACAILPEHVHVVVYRPVVAADQIVTQLKAYATISLDAESIHPFQHIRLSNGRHPKCWSRGEWAVFLNSEADVLRAIKYVEGNPLKDGKPRQRWSFVRSI